MTRALIILNSHDKRLYAARQIMNAPDFARVEIKAAKRTLPQNSLLWVLLTKISRKANHCGNRYPPDVWKVLFMHAMGKEMKFMPALDGKGFMPLGHSSSDLSVQEMTDLIEFIFAWCAQSNIEIEPMRKAA